MYIYIYTHTHTHTHAHIHTYTYTHTQISELLFDVFGPMQLHLEQYPQFRVYIYIYIYMYACIFTHTHTYIHTLVHTHTQISELLFDVFGPMQLHLEQYPQFKHDVAVLLRAIGAKILSRETRTRLLEREVNVNVRLRDAPSLLRDLMHVGYSVLCAQFSVVIGVPDVLALSSHGAPFYGALMLSQDCEVPLHAPRADETINVWYRTVNPMNRMYAMRLCELLAEGAGQEDADTAVGSSSFALEGLRVLRSMIHVEDPTSKHVHAATGKPDDVARFHTNLQVRWEAFLAGNLPLKGVPHTRCLWLVQDKAHAIGAAEAALTLCESRDRLVRLQAWMLLRDMMHGSNVEVQRTVTSTANSRRLFRSLVHALTAADDELANYRGRRRAYLQMMKHASKLGDGAHADIKPPQSALGARGETALALTVAQQLFSCASAERLKGDGGVLHAAGRLLLKLQDVLALALNDGDHEPVELATQVCYVLAAGISGDCCQRFVVFHGAEAFSDRMKFGLMVQRCFSGLQYHTVAHGSDEMFETPVGVTVRSAEMNEHLCDLRRALLYVCMVCSNDELVHVDADIIIAHAVRLGLLLGIESLHTDEPKPYMHDRHAKFSRAAGTLSSAQEDAASAVMHESLSTVPLGAWYREKGLPKELLKSVYVVQRLVHIHGALSRTARALASLRFRHVKLWSFVRHRMRSVEIKCKDGSLQRIHFTVEDSLLAARDYEGFWLRQNDALLEDCLQENAAVRAKMFLKRISGQLSAHRALTAYDNFRTRWLLWAEVYRGEVEAVPRMIAVAAMLIMVIFYGVPVTGDTADALFGGAFTTDPAVYHTADAAVGTALAGLCTSTYIKTNDTISTYSALAY
jgi:hypothetical protein